MKVCWLNKMYSINDKHYMTQRYNIRCFMPKLFPLEIFPSSSMKIIEFLIRELRSSGLLRKGKKFLTLEDQTETLSRNVGNNLPLLVA
jgi:hypothetical protein